MSDNGKKPIGGYFELELPRSSTLPYRAAMRFQSARAAFLALLRARPPRRVWMPRFICDAMVSPLQAANVECVWYDLDEKLAIDHSVRVEEGDWLLYVNYFGLQKSNVANLLERFPPEQIVLDCSQAFFEQPIAQVLATIYSPRKFFGVPDGGLIVSGLSIEQPKNQDIDSIGRMSHLIKRMAISPEAGYRDYQQAEESLSDSEPKRMSELTAKLLGSIDYEHVKYCRRENFLLLHQEIGELNLLDIGLNEGEVPLCYPFMTGNRELRQKLIASRIFVPTYWPDANKRVAGKWAEKFIGSLLPLPIDQRYGQKDMKRIASEIKSEL